MAREMLCFPTILMVLSALHTNPPILSSPLGSLSVKMGMLVLSLRVFCEVKKITKDTAIESHRC